MQGGSHFCVSCEETDSLFGFVQVAMTADSFAWSFERNVCELDSSPRGRLAVVQRNVTTVRPKIRNRQQPHWRWDIR